MYLPINVNLVDFYAFLPGRTVVTKHVLSDLLSLHDTSTYRFMLPALMTLYLEQRNVKLVNALGRLETDKLVSHYHMTVWNTVHPVNHVDALYFMVLATQYIVRNGISVSPRHTLNFMPDHQAYP